MVKRILIIDDEIAFLMAIQKVLSLPDRIVDTADNKMDALKLLEEFTYQVVVADLRLTGILCREGLELIEHVRHCCPGTRIILITGSGSSDVRQQAFDLGADNYFEKPVSPHLLRTAIEDLGG